VRAAALSLNAAARDVREGVMKLVGVLDAQSEALSQLLAPASPQDLTRQSNRGTGATELWAPPPAGAASASRTSRGGRYDAPSRPPPRSTPTGSPRS
jgi:hypothetical protein